MYIDIIVLDDSGSATENDDFDVPNSATFADGEAETFVSVTIENDDDVEATTESFTLELVAPSDGQVVDPYKTTVLIFDNDDEEEEEDGGTSLGSLATLTFWYLTIML